MKKILIALFITFGILYAPAQCPMDITLSTQEEVDNFFNEYPDCTHLPGKLSILGSQINNLNALLPLESVAGSLIINGQSTTDPALPSLEGLNNLQYIGGGLSITNNISLTNLNGLNNLDSLRGGLNIGNCALDNLIGLENLQFISGMVFIVSLPSLEGLNSLSTIYGDLYLTSMQSLEGLDSLNYIGGDFMLVTNNQLLSLNGLQNLDSIGGNFNISTAALLENINELFNLQSIGGSLFITFTSINNLSGLHHIKEIHGDVNMLAIPITNFSGLENLVSIGGNLNLSNLFSLTDLTGFNNLISVNGYFYMGILDNLESLSALSSLEYVGGDFRLEHLGNSPDSTLITNLEGLENLNYVGGDFAISDLRDLKNLNNLQNLSYIGNDVKIYDNDSLSACSIPVICGKLYYPEDSIIIHDNNMGCNSQEEIESFCDVITGTCSDSILFNMQNQVDDFSINYPGCSTITGNVTIASTQIDNLEGLSGITDIEGDLTILNTDHLTDFHGLHNLSHVGGDLTIMKIDSIQNLNVFSNLLSVDSSLVIDSNISLNSLSGLDNLTHLNGNLIINNNDMLINCSGLDNLLFINGSLRIIGNNLLQNCSGLDNITSINKTLYISANSLSSLNSLIKLSYIGGGISIFYNDNLKTLSGLDSVQTLGGRFLSIQSNDSLMNISALTNIDSSILDLSIFNNPRLSECAIAPICSGITTPDSYIYIAWNASGCDSTEEVLYNCESVTSQVTGLVYIDMNCDSIYDNGDFVISGHILNNVSDAYPFAASSAGGHFQRFLTPQSSYSFAPDSLSGYSFFPDAYSLVTTNAILNYSGRDFRFCPDSSFHNVQVTLTDVWHPKPGFTTQYQVCVNNTGTYYENVTFTVDFSTTGASDFIYNLEAAGGIVTGNSITFNTGLSPFTPLCFTINMTLSSGTPLGLDLVAHAEVQIIDGFPETSQSDNTADLTSLIVGSFDPNDKTVYPQEIDYDAIDDDIYLEYLIRFQNTGTFPATFVEILDTLDSKLDIRSIEMISASHPYTLSFPDQQILKWRFDNINLPDSSSNEPESHGFIRFKIKALPGLTPSDLVSNKAYIIFDYNTPVVTNTASTSVIVSLPEINAANRFQIYAYPNPTDENIILSFNLPESNEIGILISDTKGAILKQFNIAKQPSGECNYKIDLSDLVPGTYFIKVISKNNVGLVKVVKLK